MFPYWTNEVYGSASPADPSVPASTAGSGAAGLLGLGDILHCDPSSSEECWEEVVLSSFVTDLPWVLDTAPTLLKVTGRLLVLSGQKGSATVKLNATNRAGRAAGSSASAQYVRKGDLLDNVNPFVNAARKAGLCPTGSPVVDKLVVLEPPLRIPYGTHHTKMCLAVNAKGLRVAVFSANLVGADWLLKTQGVYVQDFPRITSAGEAAVAGSRGADFKASLLQYLRCCELAQLPADNKSTTCDIGLFGHVDCLDAFDFTQARVSLVPSVPGSHSGAELDCFGMNRLASLVRATGVTPAAGTESEASLAGLPPTVTLSWQYSSQGSLNEHFISSLQTAMVPPGCALGDVQVVYPTEAEVQNSLEGWRGGLSLPVRLRNCHDFINARLHRWGRGNCDGGDDEAPSAKRQRREGDAGSSAVQPVDVDSSEMGSGVGGSGEKNGRESGDEAGDIWRLALPHLKSYSAHSAGCLHWFLLTSANLSQAAWGAPSKNTKVKKLFIRSYELGVLYDGASVVPVGREDNTNGQATWHTITPSRPIKLPTSRAAGHQLLPVPIAEADGRVPMGALYLPYSIINPAPYASTAALRAVASGPAVGEQQRPPHVSSQDIPWVVDIPHRGQDSHGFLATDVFSS